MSDPFIGQILLFAGNFAPANWAFCNGQLLPISQYSALFSLLGTTYGGNGTTNFALPDLRGRAPVHFGQGAGLSNYVLGEATGSENVTLSTQQIPAHNHTLVVGATAATVSTPANNALAEPTPVTRTASAINGYIAGAPTPAAGLHPASIALTGGSQPHANIQPVLAVSFIIALVGVYPSHG